MARRGNLWVDVAAGRLNIILESLSVEQMASHNATFCFLLRRLPCTLCLTMPTCAHGSELCWRVVRHDGNKGARGRLTFDAALCALAKTLGRGLLGHVRRRRLGSCRHDGRIHVDCMGSELKFERTSQRSCVEPLHRFVWIRHVGFCLARADCLSLQWGTRVRQLGLA